MADDDLAGSARITITLDDTGVVADAERLAQRIRRALDWGTRGIGRRISANIRDGLKNISVSVQVEPDIDRDEFIRRVQNALRGASVTVPVVPDLRGFNQALRQHRLPTLTVPVRPEVDRSAARGGALAGLSNLLGSTARITSAAVGIGLLASAAASAAAELVTFAAALAPAIGIVAAIPAAAGVAAVALGSLGLALSGVADAFTAGLTGSAQEFEESLEGLSPAAQDAAREVRALKPAFDDLRSSVQDAFFAPLAGQITATADALGSVLGPALRQVAGDWGFAASEALSYISSAQGVARIQQILDGTQAVTGAVAEEVYGLTRAFFDLAGTISEAFGEQAGQALAAQLRSLSEFLTAAASDDRAVTWVRDAVTVFQQLGTVLGNVGSLLRSVFSAAQAAGGDVLGSLAEVTGRLAEFARSESGMQSLINIFETLQVVGAALGPVFAELVRQIGGLAPGFVPIVQALGPTLTEALSALGPALQAILPGIAEVAVGLGQAVTSLAPVLQPLGEAIGAAFGALSPLLPVLGQFAALIGTVLAGQLRALTAVLAPVIDALARSLAPVLPQLASLFQQALAAALPLATVIGQSLGTALQQLLPPILALVPQLLTGLMPAFQQLVTAVTPLIPLLLQFAVTALQPIIQILPQLVGLFVALVGVATQLLPVLQQILPPILQIGTALLSWVNASVVIPFLSLIVGALTGLARALGWLVGVVAGAVNQVIGWFRTLYNILVGNSIIPELILAIQRWFLSLPGRILGAVASAVNSVVSWFARLPGRVASALASLASTVSGAITRAGRAAVGAAQDWVARIVGAFTGLAGRIADAIGDVAGAIRRKISGAVSSLPGFVRDVIPGFANGGIVTRPTLATVGEGGRPEVIIPLTRPRRAMQLAQQSGLLRLLDEQRGQRGRQTQPAVQGGDTHHHWHIQTVMQDPMVLAEHLQGRLARATGV